MCSWPQLRRNWKKAGRCESLHGLNTEADLRSKKVHPIGWTFFCLMEYKTDRRVAHGVVPSTENGRGSHIKSNSSISNVTEESGDVKARFASFEDVNTPFSPHPYGMQAEYTKSTDWGAFSRLRALCVKKTEQTYVRSAKSVRHIGIYLNSIILLPLYLSIPFLLSLYPSYENWET